MEPEKQFILICAGAMLGFYLNLIINSIGDTRKERAEEEKKK